MRKHAAQTALQLLRQSTSVAGGTAVDWPNISRAWPASDPAVRTRRVLHRSADPPNGLSEDEFPFSYTCPTTSASGCKAMCIPRSHPRNTIPKHEIRDLIAYAASYNIEVVGDIDFPGHMHAILAAHPELKAAPDRRCSTGRDDRPGPIRAATTSCATFSKNSCRCSPEVLNSRR